MHPIEFTDIRCVIHNCDSLVDIKLPFFVENVKIDLGTMARSSISEHVTPKSFINTYITYREHDDDLDDEYDDDDAKMYEL